MIEQTPTLNDKTIKVPLISTVVRLFGQNCIIQTNSTFQSSQTSLQSHSNCILNIPNDVSSASIEKVKSIILSPNTMPYNSNLKVKIIPVDMFRNRHAQLNLHLYGHGLKALHYIWEFDAVQEADRYGLEWNHSLARFVHEQQEKVLLNPFLRCLPLCVKEDIRVCGRNKHLP